MVSPPQIEVVFRTKRHVPTARDRKRIVDAVEERRAAIYREWLEKAMVRGPGEEA